VVKLEAALRKGSDSGEIQKLIDGMLDDLLPDTADGSPGVETGEDKSAEDKPAEEGPAEEGSAYPGRARECDLRAPGDLPQPAEEAQFDRDADPGRVREDLRAPIGSGMKSNGRTPRNPGNITGSGQDQNRPPGRSGPAG